MQVMPLGEETCQLTGRVEVDDAYLGGERSGGKTCRGSENKVSFFAAVQTTNDGKPHLACFSQRPFTKESFTDFMAKSMVLPLTVVSDGLGCFTVTPTMGASHERTVTGGGKECVKHQQFWAVNTVLGNLKTALSGTYHAIKFAKYAGRYLAEVQYRFNRRYDLRAILGRLVGAAAATLPHQEAVLRDAELHREICMRPPD